MYPQFIDLTRENLAQQHLCCIKKMMKDFWIP